MAQEIAQRRPREGREDETAGPQRGGRPPQYGVRDFDLSTDRAAVDDFELIRLRTARSITPLTVPAECYLRFGSKEAPRLDLRDYVGQQFNTFDGEPFGEVWLENPTGVTGTLELFFGSEVGVESNPEIGTIGSITSPVDVEAQDGALFDRTTSTGTNVSVNHATGPVSVVVDASGAATVTIEVGDDASFTNVTAFTESVSASADDQIYVVHGFQHVRARVDSNLNSVSIGAKGVGG